MRAAVGPRFSTRIRRRIVLPGPWWSMMWRWARGLSARLVGTTTSRMPKLPGPGPAAAWAGLASAPVAAASAAATSMSALRSRRTILLRRSGHGVRDRAGVQAGDRRGGDGYGDRRVPCRGVVATAGAPADNRLRRALQRQGGDGRDGDRPGLRDGARGVGGIGGGDGLRA